MGAHNLMCCLGKHQVAYLRACIDGIQRRASVRVPEADVTVSCATTSGKKAVLVGGPSDGFHGSSMLMEFYDWFGRVQIPDH